MKRGTIAAVISALVGVGGAGLALGLPIDPATPSVDSTSAQVEPIASEASEVDPVFRLSGETQSGTLDLATQALPRDFSLGEVLEVPEPDSAVLFGLGMILLGVVGRRREEASPGL